ncbi:hypothetical protein NDU88_000421, partial [Pleurodeles waltl]
DLDASLSWKKRWDGGSRWRFPTASEAAFGFSVLHQFLKHRWSLSCLHICLEPISLSCSIK